MASAVNPIVAATNAAGAASTAATQSANAPAPSEQMFLQLLVSQIQNQDPLNPTDSSQFVSQLAQFSELEQVIAIRGDIEKAQSTTGAAATSGTPAAPSTPPVPTTPGIFGGSSTTGTPSGTTSQS